MLSDGRNQMRTVLTADAAVGRGGLDVDYRGASRRPSKSYWGLGGLTNKPVD